jgi:hypothetical protein
MSRCLPIAAVQAEPVPVDGTVEAFARQEQKGER